MNKIYYLLFSVLFFAGCAQKSAVVKKEELSTNNLERKIVAAPAEPIIEYKKPGLNDLQSPTTCATKRACSFILPLQKCVSYKKEIKADITNLILKNDCSHEISIFMEVKGLNGKEVLPAIVLEDVLLPGAAPVLRVRNLKEEIIKYNISCFSKKSVENNMKIKLHSGGATIQNGFPQCLYTTL